jgi:hypothetical protein
LFTNNRVVSRKPEDRNMQLMLDTGELEMGLNGGNGRGAEPNRTSEVASWWSFTVRLGLAVAAVCAAWFLVTSAWPAEIAMKTLAGITVETGSVPGPLGTILASLH